VTREADELAIRNLLARIAHEADLGEDLTAYVACFSEDASWEMPEAPPVRGREALLRAARARRAAREVGPGSDTRHVIDTTEVHVRDATASALSYFQFWGDTRSTPRLRVMGHYRDTFRREAGGWCLVRRRITIG